MKWRIRQLTLALIPALLNQFQTEDIQFKLFNQRQAGIQTAYCYHNYFLAC